MQNVATDMMTMDSDSAFRRPSLSPMWPQKKPPSGRTRKEMAKTREGGQQCCLAVGFREEDRGDDAGQVAVDGVVEPFDEVADEARGDDPAAGVLADFVAGVGCGAVGLLAGQRLCCSGGLGYRVFHVSTNENLWVASVATLLHQNRRDAVHPSMGNSVFLGVRFSLWRQDAWRRPVGGAPRRRTTIVVRTATTLRQKAIRGRTGDGTLFTFGRVFPDALSKSGWL